MNKVFVIGLHSDRKAILEELHKKEIIEVCKSSEVEAGCVETANSIKLFEKHMKSAESALAVLNEYTTEKTGLFANRRILPLQRYHMASVDSKTTLQTIFNIIRTSDNIRDHKESIRQITAEQIALEPYLPLDLPMNIYGTEHTFFKVGTISGKWSSEQLQKETVVHELDSAYFEILNTTREHTYVWFAFLKSQEQNAKTFLQGIGFSDPVFDLSRHAPQEKRNLLEEEKIKLTEKIQIYISELVEKHNSRRDIELFYDHLSLRKEKYQVLSKIGMTENVFCIEGYLPAKYGDNIKQYFENKWLTYVKLTEPENPEDVPIAFQNNVFASSVEEITETYSMPSPVDIDPNPVMAFFYYLFFGMMFSDAGYGLLLMLVCGYLGFSKRLEKSRQKTFKMFFFCGVSTTFWGILYGSFFGDMIYTVSGTFFGKQIALTPIWLDPISQALKLLIFSVAFGMIQILTGLVLKFYTLYRQKKTRDAMFDVGFWIVVLSGISFLSAGMLLEFSVLTNIGILAAMAGVVGLLITGGRKNKNIFGKVFGGVVGLYDITGYVSDALSYCRLMALGLATACIANVVNLLGAMFGSSTFGIFLFIVIAILGHGLNFAMNMLGAYVHTNRLQYVEFYSKFYEGGGRKFVPFCMNTKYYQFLEE